MLDIIPRRDDAALVQPASITADYIATKAGQLSLFAPSAAVWLPVLAVISRLNADRLYWPARRIAQFHCAIAATANILRRISSAPHSQSRQPLEAAMLAKLFPAHQLVGPRRAACLTCR